MPNPTLRSFLTRGLVAGFVLSLPLGTASADPVKVKTLLAAAEQHEKAYEWDKAFAAYDAALKFQRDIPSIKDRQTNVLRRYWQELRHKDISYRKEVLGLDYAQALRLNNTVFDTLLDTSMPRKKLSPGLLLKKGIEELETALADPGFLQNYLPTSKPLALGAYRDFLAGKKAEAGKLNRRDSLKALREVALAGQTSLDLPATVILMEMACGSCYAIDEYTAYLTPTQFRELTESVKPSMSIMRSVHQEGLRTMDMGYMHISHFQDSTPQEVEEVFFRLNKAGMKGLIIDLRGNPGGLIESSVEVARKFLSQGIIATTENYDPKLNMVYHARNDAAWTVPVVVLVDSDTASAAEVLAGALKDNGRARILGQPTFGKGSLQGLVKLPDALGGLPTGGLRLTIARFLSPKGLPYAGTGVIPDLVLAPEVLDDVVMAAAVADLHRQMMR